MAAHLVRDPLHTTLMPPIPRTRSLYELPKRDSQDYRFRNTVSFWIAVSFVEGSLLFICGALASALALREAWKQRGLVEFAYFAGSLFYTLGSYLGFFQVINLGRDRIRLFACSGTSPALLNTPRGGRRADPLRVMAHDLRSFHPGQAPHARRTGARCSTWPVQP